MDRTVVLSILEALKDHVNEDGKRELLTAQKAISEWKVVDEPEEIQVFTTAIVPEVVEVPPKPKRAVKKTVRTAPKAKKKK